MRSVWVGGLILTMFAHCGSQRPRADFRVTGSGSCKDIGDTVTLEVSVDGHPGECREPSKIELDGPTNIMIDATLTTNKPNISYTLTGRIPALPAGTYNVWPVGCQLSGGTYLSRAYLGAGGTHGFFTTPCPKDAAPDAPSDANPTGSLVGSVQLQVDQPAPMAPKSMYGSGEVRTGPAMERKAISDAFDREASAAATLPLGTCGDDPRPDLSNIPNYPNVKGLDLGSTIDLKSGMNTSGVMNRSMNAGSYSYLLGLPTQIAAGTTYDVAFAGGAEVAAAMLGGALSIPADLNITSAAYNGLIQPYPNGSFKLDWTPGNFGTMLVGPRLPVGKTKQCRVDPMLGTLDVPQMVIDSGKNGPGGNIDLEITLYKETMQTVKVNGLDSPISVWAKNTKHIRFKSQ